MDLDTIPAPAPHDPSAGADPADVSFRVSLRDGCEELVTGADAYQQEQSMTTFFRTEGRRTVDCWAVRVASFRTDQILAVRRQEPTGHRHLRPV